MTRKNTAWSPVNRLPGESADAWRHRAHAAHRDAWRREKIRNGTWRSPEDYAREVGRPASARTPAEQVLAPSPATAAATEPTVQPAASVPVYVGLAHDAGIAAALSLATTLARGGDAGEATTSAAGAAAKAVAVGVAREGVERMISREATKSVARSVAQGALRNNAVGEIACALVEQTLDSARVLSGRISGREYAVRTVSNAAGAGGGIGGAYVGAALGTALLPGVGTAIGLFLGGLLGGNGTRALSRRLFG